MALSPPIYRQRYLLSFLLLLKVARGQVGTITQDITAASAYSQQKPCAQSCFVDQGVCNIDILGGDLGCADNNSCNQWAADNDCYCRSDQQLPAQRILTSCISRRCSVGDLAIDASSAGSIYAGYCLGKGYTPATTPANVPATTTGAAAAPSSSSTGQNSPSSSSSGTLSTAAIIGIAVGGLVGISIISFLIRYWRNGERDRQQTQHQQQQYPPIHQPSYPMPRYPEQLYYPKPTMNEEIHPDDSASNIGGYSTLSGPMPPPAPTVLSSPYRR